jgi:hypothetical protein
MVKLAAFPLSTVVDAAVTLNDGVVSVITAVVELAVEVMSVFVFAEFVVSCDNASVTLCPVSTRLSVLIVVLNLTLVVAAAAGIVNIPLAESNLIVAGVVGSSVSAEKSEPCTAFVPFNFTFTL